MHELSRFDGRDGTGGWPRRPRLPRLALADQSGSILVEVLVSAIMVVIVAVGVFAAFDTATRATGEERNRARAHSLAQADLSRMRTMRISDLSNLNQTRTLTQDGTEYTIVSRGEFQTDATGTASCDPGTASADYIKISSTVTWPSIGSRPPVVAASLVAPPNGSISPNTGSLAVEIQNSENAGIPGVGLQGSGAGSFTGQTGPTGCAIFGNLPAGNYTLQVTDSTLVDRDGNPPGDTATSVVAEATNTVVLQYDEPGSVAVTFETKVGGNLVPSTADSVVAFNQGMSVPKAFGDVGSQAGQVTATPLFPFTSEYAIYAGTCEGNNPNPTGQENPPGEAAIASAIVPRGGSEAVSVQLPALHLTVWSGVDQTTPGSPVPGAAVELSDANCDDSAGNPITRTFTTTSEGKFTKDPQGQTLDPGLPYGVYDLCVSDGTTHVTRTSVNVQDLDVGADLSVYLNEPGALPGGCP